MDILSKIKKAGLVGRGGAGFPTATKWEMVKRAVLTSSTRDRSKKYVICNASEGEPGVLKDGYILEHFPEKVIDGMKIAINFLLAGKGYIYINNKYYKKFAKNLEKIINGAPIELFIKPLNSGYIGGEETSILNAIEGKRVEPRLRPPFPTESGLWGYPTLINNVETFYNVSLVASDSYKNTRFYTVNGDCKNEGVYELPDNYTIAHVLKETKNYPNFPFFIQVGGEASGEVLNSRQLSRPVSGAGSIMVYSLTKNSPKKVIKNWLDFFINESCGQCTPCREGVYRLNEIIIADKIDWQLFSELLNNLSEAAFCGLGNVVPIPIKSFIKNVVSTNKQIFSQIYK